MLSGSTRLRARFASRLTPGSTAMWAVLALQVAVLVLLLTRSFEVGSRKGGYLFLFARSAEKVPLLPFVVALAVVPAFAVGLRWVGRREVATVVAWLLFAALLQAVLHRQAQPVSMQEIIRGDQYGDFLIAAERYAGTEFLRDFETDVPNLSDRGFLHVKSNMPGKVVLVDVLDSVLGSRRTLAWTLAVLSVLGAGLVYVLARLVLGSARASLLAMALYVVMPGRLGFLPVMNTVTPLFILGTFVLVLLYVRTRRRWPLWALGPILYATLFFDPLPLVMVGVIAVVAAATHRQAAGEPGRVAVAALVPLAGFVLTFVVVRLTTGFDLFGGLQTVADDAADFNRAMRPRWSDWVLPNLREFTLSAGAAVLGLTMLSVASSLVPVAMRQRSLRALQAPGERFTLAALATLSILLLAGVNRGEVGRLWIFLGAFLCIAAARACVELLPPGGSYVVLGATAVQAVAVTSMVLLPVSGYFHTGNVARSWVLVEVALLVFVVGAVLLVRTARSIEGP